MNIIDAIKSGKRIRRAGAVLPWLTPVEYGLEDIGYPNSRLRYSKEDILSEEWEVEESASPITAKQFWNAVLASDFEGVAPHPIDLDKMFIWADSDKTVKRLRRLAILLGVK